MPDQSELIFYEKPGCIGNARQQSLLRSQGIAFEVRDLINHPWSAESLRTFFGGTPVAQWFNSSAPRVKSGQIPIDSLTQAQALELMLRDPLLIRRPLLELGRVRQSGFVQGPVLEALQVVLDPAESLQDCPMDGAQPDCEDSA
jgi:nitrogenase-associated protein